MSAGQNPALPGSSRFVLTRPFRGLSSKVVSGNIKMLAKSRHQPFGCHSRKTELIRITKWRDYAEYHSSA